MRKRILALAIGCCAMLLSVNPVNAQSNASVYVTENEQLKISNVELSTFEGMAPGDSRQEEILVINKSDNEKDFFILQETIKTLEETNKSAGGAYKFDLRVGDTYKSSTSLLNTEAGGYDNNGNASTKGLGEIDELSNNKMDVDGYTYLTHLDAKCSTHLYMDLEIVGEGNDNKASSANTMLGGNGLGYTNALGKIKISFKCTTPSHSGQDKFKNIIKEVQTGDDFSIGLYVLILLLGIGIVLLIGKIGSKEKKDNKTSKLFAIMLVLSLLMLLGSGENVQAEQKITVTFRSGEMGDFNVASVGRYASDNVKVTKDYIRVSVNKAENLTIKSILVNAFGRSDVDNIFAQFTVPNGCMLLNSKDWGVNLSHIIKHNEEYTVDYGVLVNPVKYTIRYVDESSYDENSNTYKQEVAAPIINYGNAGDVIAISPVSVGNYRNVEGNTSITLKEGRDNDYVFHYEYTGTEKEGKTRTTVTYRVINKGHSGNNSHNRNSVTNNANDDIAGESRNNTNNGDQAGNSRENESTNIDDNQTPLNDGKNSNIDDDESKESGTSDDSVHRSNTIKDGKSPEGINLPDPLAYYLIGISIIVVIVLGITLYLSGKGDSKKNANSEKK